VVISVGGRDVRLETDDAAVLTQTLNDLLDSDDFKGVLKEARRLRTHPNAEVRSRVAFALSWAGVQALPDLTAMLTDPDPDVAREALDYWKNELADLDSDADKAAMLGSAAKVFGEDISDDFLSDLVMECATLEPEVALPQLSVMLQQVQSKEQIEEVTDAIQAIISADEPATTKDGTVQQINEYLARQAAERNE